MPMIAPLAAPYSDEVQASFDKLMPDGMEPLALFKTLAHNPRVLRRIQRGGLLDPGSISVRLRELIILRTCALCGAEYEWGVHVAIFAKAAELGGPELHGLLRPLDDTSRDTLWSPLERAVLDIVDSLHASSAVDEAILRRAAETLSHAQIIEVVTLAGLYHAVSFLVNVTGVEGEPWAPGFEGAGGDRVAGGDDPGGAS